MMPDFYCFSPLHLCLESAGAPTPWSSPSLTDRCRDYPSTSLFHTGLSRGGIPGSRIMEGLLRCLLFCFSPTGCGPRTSSLAEGSLHCSAKGQAASHILSVRIRRPLCVLFYLRLDPPAWPLSYSALRALNQVRPPRR